MLAFAFVAGVVVGVTGTVACLGGLVIWIGIKLCIDQDGGRHE